MPAKRPAKKTGSVRGKITRDTALGELVAKYPGAVEVMLRRGLHCAGCHMAAHESISQGAAAHGMSEKAIEKMLKEMNEMAG